MKAKKILSLLLVGAMAASILTGCSSKGDDNGAQTGDQTSQESQIDKNQYYNGFLSAEPTSLDVAKGADNYSGTVLMDILEPLTRLEEDENGSNFVAPAGAERWESNEDGTVWTFHLRDNKWSDGVDVKAQDYEYGIKRVLDPKTGAPYAYLLLPIKNADAVNKGELSLDELGVKALDEKTLEITLEEPTPYFLSLTYLRPMYPQRQDIVEKHGDTHGAEAETVVCNGPFVIDSWTHNSEIILKKNSNYWDNESVKLEQVNYKIINDINAVYNSLENNSIDSGSTGSTEWLERFSKNEKLDHVSYTNPNVNFKFFNQKDKLFSNANVRKAFAIAINREEIADVIFNGMNEAAYGWVPKQIQVENTEYREVVEEPLKTLKDDTEDPKALLVKGLEELGMDTDLSKLDVTLTLGGTDQWFRTYGEYIQQMYKTTLGVNINIEFNDWPVFMSKVEKGEYQIGYMSWGAEFNDPISMLSLLTSDSNAILTGWSNEEYDNLIKQARAEMDPEKRLELYKKAEHIALYEDCVIAPTVYTKSNLFRYNYMKDMPSTPFGTQGLKYTYTEGREK